MLVMKDLIHTLITDPAFAENLAWRKRPFGCNENIIEEGDEGNSLFFVEEGKLQVNVGAALEQNRNIQQGIGKLRAGDLFGEISLHGAYPRTASVKAISEGLLLEIDSVHLNDYLDQHPAFGYQFYKALFHVLIKRLDLANNRVESLFVWGLKAHGIEKHL